MTPAVQSLVDLVEQLPEPQFEEFIEALSSIENITQTQHARLRETIRRLDAGESVRLDGPSVLASARAWATAYFAGTEATVGFGPMGTPAKS
jgi:hypothetical protein